MLCGPLRHGACFKSSGKMARDRSREAGRGPCSGKRDPRKQGSKGHTPDLHPGEQDS